MGIPKAPLGLATRCGLNVLLWFHLQCRVRMHLVEVFEVRAASAL